MTFAECLENVRREMLNMLERLEEQHERELAEAKTFRRPVSAPHKQNDSGSDDVTQSDMGKSVFVSISRAQDLCVDASSLNMPQHDYQCVCQVDCSSSQRQCEAQLIASVVDSIVIPNRPNETFQEVHEGESLSISIYDGSNWRQDSLVGSVALSSSQFYASGFEGEVRLVDTTGTSRFSLDIAVRLSRRTPPQPYGQLETVVHKARTSLESDWSVGAVGDVLSIDSKLILLHALQQGTDEEVIDLLNSKANPNAEFANVKCFGKNFSLCNPFSLVVLESRESLFIILLEHRADINSTYGFPAGADQKLWTGPAIHAAIPGGKLRMIKELLSLQADAEAPGSNGATVLWNASYFGQTSIVNHMLTLSVDLEARATSPDEQSRSYTPLHTAARQGNLAVVKALILAHANVETEDGQFFNPIDDAIESGEGEVVKLLIEHHANFFKLKPKPLSWLLNRSSHDEHGGRRAIRASRLSNSAEQDIPNPRGIDLMFSRGNPVVISAVAQGLSAAPPLLRYVSKSDLLHFLHGTGATAVNILSSIIQPHKVQYWTLSSDGKKRRNRKVTAYIDSFRKMNVGVGPHNDVLHTMFNTKEILTEDLTQFVNANFPEEARQRTDEIVPISCFMCHVPEIHKDIEIATALADHPLHAVYYHKGCQGVLHFMWCQVMRTALVSTAISSLEVISLVMINFVMNCSTCCDAAIASDTECKLDECAETDRKLLLASNSLALIAWTMAVILQVAEFNGLRKQGLTRIFCESWTSWINILVDSQNMVVIALSMNLSFDSKRIPFTRWSMGLGTFIKWMRFVGALCQWKVVGIRVLPLLKALANIGPFSWILFCSFMGAWNWYYALGVTDPWSSLVLMFQLVILGESTLISKVVEEEEKVLAQILMLFVSLTMQMGLLSIFIAVLGKSYDEAAENAEAIFGRYRLRKSLQHISRLRGLSLRCCCQHRRSSEFGLVKSFRDTVMPSVHSDDVSDGEEDEESAFRYMWICTEKPLEEEVK